MKKFNCIEDCGECCRHIHLVDELKHLQNGNGICKYLENNRCTIYETRPDVCRYDKTFEIVNNKLKNKLTIEQYDEMAIKYCEILQNLKIQNYKEIYDKETSFVKTTS